VSELGRKALEAKDASIPSDYRTILWVMEFQGTGHLKPLMSMYAEQRLSDCLAEMAELGLVEKTQASETGDATIPPSPPQEIVSLSKDDLAAAGDVLSRDGAYLSDARLKERRGVEKAPSNINILIVEDDPDQLALADVRVSMAGYSVRVADSQASLLRSLAEQGAPDLILLDVTLPDGDGFDILRRLRSLASFAPLPIVMLTAKTDPNDIAKGIRLGADGYVTKPYSKEVVATVIKHILRT
jgi:CheY-like chemotaxis protein